MVERTWWQCHHNGEPKGQRWIVYSEAWMEIHHLQGQSASYAFTYGGWKIEEVIADGTIVTGNDET